MLGGIQFDNAPALAGNSDADVVLHAITNAVSGVTGVNILGSIADEMCNTGITDSAEYLKEALNYLDGYKITHISISIECKRPRVLPRIKDMKTRIAKLLAIATDDVGITATSGEGLTDFGRGLGVQALAVITVVRE